MPNQYPGSQRPLDTSHPLFVHCQQTDSTHRAEYEKVEAAEAYYLLHNKKGDPVFRDAISAVRQARSTFRMKVNMLYMTVGPTLPKPPLTPEEQADADRRNAARQERVANAQLYLAENIANNEALWRAVLDQPERFQLPVELQTEGVNNGTAIITHRHAIYATMLGFLQREGLAGLSREWSEWGCETLRRSLKLTEQCFVSTVSIWERGKGYQEVETGEEYSNRDPIDRMPAPKPKPTKAEREEEKAFRTQLESNAKAAKRMREYRASKKATTQA